MAEVPSQIQALLRLAVERITANPADEQRYLELLFSVDRAVERDLRYYQLRDAFEEGAAAAEPGKSWAWRLAEGLAENLMGDNAAAAVSLERAWAGIVEAGQRATATGAFILSELARSHYHRGTHGPGIEAATRALQVSRAANSPLAEAYGHHYLGLISGRRHDREFARRHLETARRILEDMKQRLAYAKALDSLALLDIEDGSYDVARKLLEESLATKEELHDLRGQALACGNLAELHGRLGDYERARHYLERKRQLSARIGDERSATLVCIQMGQLHLRYGHPHLARRELQEALRRARDRHDERGEALAAFTLARAERRLGHPQTALQAMQPAVDYFLTADEPVMRARTQLRRSLLLGEGSESPAVQRALEELQAAAAGDALAEALFEASEYAREEDDRMRATTLCAAALDAAEPAQAIQLAEQMRLASDSAEGRAWVAAMLTVKQQKDSLERAYMRLRDAERLRESLTQMIVHDLKNPIAAILPWLQVIYEDDLPADEARKYLGFAIDECEYLLRMIEDMNVVGRLQHEGRLELVVEPLDLAALVGESVRRLRGRARESGMELVQSPVGPLPPVQGDASKLRRVLENLIANAIKYGRPPQGSGRSPEIRLEVAVERPQPGALRHYVQLRVCDHGEGIPLAESERIFEPYYQAEAGRRRKAGVGLGLTYVRMVVEAHQGSVWYEPSAEGGCPALHARLCKAIRPGGLRGGGAGRAHRSRRPTLAP